MQLRKILPVSKLIDLDDTLSVSVEHRDPLSLDGALSFDLTYPDDHTAPSAEVDQAMRRGTSMAYNTEHSIMGKTEQNTIETGSQKDFSLLSLHPDQDGNTVVANDDKDFPRTERAAETRKRTCFFVFLTVLILLTLAAVAGGTICVTGSCSANSQSTSLVGPDPVPQPSPANDPTIQSIAPSTIAAPTTRLRAAFSPTRQPSFAATLPSQVTPTVATSQPSAGPTIGVQGQQVTNPPTANPASVPVAQPTVAFITRAPVNPSSSAPIPAPTRAPIVVPTLTLTTTQALYNAVDAYLAGTSAAPPIGEWDVSQITNFTNVFSGERNPAVANFNADLSKWVTSNAVTMSGMVRFIEATTTG
jgi:Mycoplasma protein of unknown function, DUF285